MKPTNTLRGIFTDRVDDAIKHAYKLAGLGAEGAMSMFRTSLIESQRQQVAKHGKVDDAEMLALLMKPSLLLPEYYPVPRFNNLVSAITVPPELVEALALRKGQQVEVKVNPHNYTPEKGISAIAARTQSHPDWVMLDR